MRKNWISWLLSLVVAVSGEVMAQGTIAPDLLLQDKQEEKTFNSLHEAVAALNDKAILEWLQKGADINARNSEGLTPLEIAIKQNSEPVVKGLLKRGAAVNDANEVENTALHVAAKEGEASIAAILVAAGADMDHVNADGQTPIHVAARYGNLPVLRMLAAFKPEIDTSDKNNMTPLYLAAMGGHSDMVKFLLTAGADVNAKDKNGDMLAFQLVQVPERGDIITMLIEKGLQLFKHNSSDKALIDYARESGDEKNVEPIKQAMNEKIRATYTKQGIEVPPDALIQ